jgi:opacity protein-like surface antigen
MKNFPFVALVAATAVSLIAFSSVHPQYATSAKLEVETRYALGVSAGVSQFDLSGTGTAGLIALRLELEAKKWFVIEASTSLFRADSDVGLKTLYTIPEMQAQLQLPLSALRPYFGVGIGAVVGSGRIGATRSLSGSSGIRAKVPHTRIDLRGELRVRGIGDSFSSSAAEWTLGAAYRF